MALRAITETALVGSRQELTMLEKLFSRNDFEAKISLAEVMERVGFDTTDENSFRRTHHLLTASRVDDVCFDKNILRLNIYSIFGCLTNELLELVTKVAPNVKVYWRECDEFWLFNDPDNYEEPTNDSEQIYFTYN